MTAGIRAEVRRASLACVRSGRRFSSLALLLGVFASSARAATLASGSPQSLVSGFPGPSSGQAAALDPRTGQVWAAGSVYDPGAGTQSGQVLAVGGKGGAPISFILRLGSSGSPCSVGSFNYCVAGASSVVRGLALDAANRRLWAAGTQYDASGANPVLFVAAIGLDTLSVASFFVETSTGTEGRGAAVSFDGTVWIAGVASGAASLWYADPVAGLNQLAFFAGSGEADAVVEDAGGKAWVAGRSGDTGEMGLWHYDPVTGTFAGNLWRNSFGASGSTGTAVALAPWGVLVAGQAATSGGPKAALWLFSNGSFSVAASTGAYGDAAYGLALDDANNAWLTGTTGVDASGDRRLALWESPAGPPALGLAAAYNDLSFAATPYANEGRGAAYAAGQLWIVGTQDNGVFSAWDYILNTGNVAGTLAYAGGFAGQSAYFFVSATPTFDQNPFQAVAAAPAAGSALTYSVSGLPAPATYYVAAVYDVSGTMNARGNPPPSDPIGLYRDDANANVTRLTPVFVPAGGGASAVNFTVALDTQAPVPAVAFPVSGSTIAASAFALSGTAGDNTSVVSVRLALADTAAGTWWDGASSFISTTATPLYAQPTQLSGPVNSVSWSPSAASLAALRAALQPGRAYALSVQARDLVGNAGAKSASFSIASAATLTPGSGQGDALARDAVGRSWVVAHDVAGGVSQNFRLERYEPGGVFQSSAAIPGADGNGRFSIAFDPGGRVYVAGAGSSGAGSALAFWRFDGGPVLQTSATYVAATGGFIPVGRLAVDASTGVWIPAAEPLATGGYRFDLLKFAADGTLLPGFPKTSQNGAGLDGGFASALDASGFVWSAGVSSNPAAGRLDFALWKHDSAGNLQAGFPVFWPGAFASVNNLDISVAFDPVSNSVWIATQKSFASCAAPELALLQYNATGTQVSSAVWHDAAGSGASGQSLAVDASGNLWVSGQSAGVPVLWEYAPNGTLVPGYPQTASGGLNFVPRALAVDAAGSPWVLSGDQPAPFNPGGAAPGAAGPALCALGGAAQVSGAVTYAAGFASGGTLTLAVSTANFQSQPVFYGFTTSTGTSFAYTLTLQAPATYTIAALVGAPNRTAPGTPIGAYADYAPVTAVAGGSRSGVNFSIAADTVPPTSAVTSFPNGSTITALSAVAGTAADNVGVGQLSLAVHDLTFDLWWQPANASWISTTTVPYFFSLNPALSGKPDNETWVQSLSGFGGLSGYLAKGHQYAFTSQAQDFVRNIEAAPTSTSFVWNGPSGNVAPNPPQNVAGQALGVSSVAWTWSAAPGASGYNVYAGTATFLGTTAQTSYAQVGLSTNAAASLCVSALNQFGEGGKNCAPAVFTLAAIPGAPFFTAASASTLALGWDPAGNPPGTAYTAFLSTDGFATVVQSQSNNQPNAFFQGLVGGTTYFARVQAFNGVGNGTPMSPQSSTMTILAPPPPPQAITGQALGISSIAWSWSASATATSFDLYNSTNGLIASVSKLSFIQVGLSTGSLNSLCVSGVNAAGEGTRNCSGSVYTNAAVPGQPYLIQVTSSALLVAWDPRGDPPNTIYEVLLSTDDFVTNISTPVPLVPSYQQTQALISALAAGTTYYVKVLAANFSGVLTDFSPPFVVATKLTPPSNPQGLALGTSSVIWTWGASLGAASYNVFSSTGGIIGTSTTTSFLEIGLSTNSQNSVCVNASNGGNSSDKVCTASIYTYAAVPGQPMATNVTSTTVAMAWDPGGNPSNTFFQVLLSTDGFVSDISTVVPFSSRYTQTSAVLSGLSAATTYFIAVQAANGASMATAPSRYGVFETRLAPPTNLQGLALGASSISWAWSASPGAAGYAVASPTGALAAVPGNAFAETGLTPNAQYSVCVTAFNGADTSDPVCSSYVYTRPAVPGQPTFAGVSYGQFTASWSASGNPYGTVYQVLMSTDGFVTNISTPVPFTANLLSATTAFLGLASNTTYSLEIEALGGDAVPTAPSAPNSVRTLLAPPYSPANLTATTDNQAKKIRLSWQPAAGGVPAATYNVFRGVTPDTFTFAPLATGTTATTYADLPGQSGTYYYQVSGVNADAVQGPRSAVAIGGVDLTAPNAVNDLRISRVLANQVTVAWTAPADIFNDATTYYLYVSPTPSFGQGTSSFTVTAQPTGSTVTYTMSVTTTQAYYFVETTIDYAGNLSAFSNIARYDPVPPAIVSISLQNNQTLSRPLTVSAIATDNVAVASVAFRVDGLLVSSSATSGFASFFFDTRLLADGGHTLTIMAWDTSANFSSVTLSETINYAPPSAPVINSPGQNFATKVATINVVGTAENTPGLTVQIQANNLDLDTAPVVNGTWQLLPEILRREGNTVLTAIAFENRGFSQPSGPVNGVFSTQAPQPPGHVQASALPGGQSQIAWSAPSLGTTPSFYRVYRSTSDTVLMPGNPAPDPSLRIGNTISQLSLMDTPAVDGLYFYAVTAVDGVGNESLLSSVVYVLTDRVPPTARVVFSTPMPVANGSYQPRFLISKVLSQPPIFTFAPPGRGASPVALNLVASSATLWQSTITITSSMSSGTAVFAFQGIDLAGNVGTVLSSSTLVIRNIGPAATVLASKSSPLSVGALTFHVSLDEAAISTPTLTVTPQGGSAIPVVLSATAPFDNTAWVGAITISSSTGDGQAIIAYSAADNLGNMSSTLAGGATYFVVKTVPPSPPQLVRANGLPGGSVLVTWSSPFGERPAYYHVYRDGVLLSTSVYPAVDGTGSYTDMAPSGLHQYQVSSLDLAGNESAPTDPTALSKSVPPLAPVNVAVSTNSFGQIQVTWLAASTDTARFAFYRTTYTVSSVAGLAALTRNAISPFVDSPVADAVYHYVVTAIDSVGNESAPSAEAVITWAQGAPSVSITGVVDGGYYNANVAPTYTITDLTLDTASVRALLDGASFVSGSTVSSEGQHKLGVSAANVAGHVSTATATFTIIKTPPQIAFGLSNNAAVTSTRPVSVSVMFSSLNLSTTTLTLVNQTLGTSAGYSSGAGISVNGQYALTAIATDLAGNVSSATLNFHLEIAPLAPTNLSVTVQSLGAQISWTSPEPDVVGYRVYRDGQRISSSLLSAPTYLDTGYSSGQHLYQVSAVDAAGIEGPKAQVTIPAASLSLQPLTLTRGFLDAVRPVVQNNTTGTLGVGPALLTLVDAGGQTVAVTTAPAITVGAGQLGAMQGVIATPPTLSASSLLHVLVSLPTDPGATASLLGDFTLSAVDPRQPIIDVIPNPLIPGAMGSVQIRFYNRGSAPMDVVTAAVSNSTYAPVSNVQVQLLTPQGTLLGQGNLLQAANGASGTFAGGQQVAFVTVPPNSSFLFDPVNVLVPNSIVTTLQVQASISTPTFNLPGLALPNSRGYSSSLSQAVVQQVSYTATAFPGKPFYDQNSTVTIVGQALDMKNLALPASSVTVHVLSNGFERDFFAVTDSSGNYATVFFPMPTEAGVYSVFAANPAIVTHVPQSSFTIVGFAFQYPSFTATMAQNSAVKFTVALQNTGATPISGLAASTSSTSGNGLSLALDPTSLPSSLAPGAQATLNLTLSASPSASTSTLVLAVSESHGFIRTLPITVTLQPALAIPSVSPQSFELGMLAGQVKTQVITLQNQGFDTWRGVSLTSPTLSWVTIQGNKNIGDIPPSGNANFTLSFAPPAGLPNASYAQNPLLQVVSLSASTVPINVGVTVTSSLQGTIIFNVINGDKPRNISGQGVPVANCTATLTSLDVPGLTYTVAGDLNGLAQFANIPAGNYSWTAAATGFQPNSNTIRIQPGLTQNLEVLMLTATVSYDWSVTPTTVLDSYNITLTETFKTDVPAPVLVTDPPLIYVNTTEGQPVYTQFTLTNKGLVSVFDVNVLPQVSDPTALRIETPTPTIPEIKPGQSITIPLKITDAPFAGCAMGAVTAAGGYQCAAGTKQSASAKVTVAANTPKSQGCGSSGGSSAAAAVAGIASFIYGAAKAAISAITGNTPASNPACATVDCKFSFVDSGGTCHYTCTDGSPATANFTTINPDGSFNCAPSIKKVIGGGS